MYLDYRIFSPKVGWVTEKQIPLMGWSRIDLISEMMITICPLIPIDICSFLTLRFEKTTSSISVTRSVLCMGRFGIPPNTILCVTALECWPLCVHVHVCMYVWYLWSNLCMVYFTVDIQFVNETITVSWPLHFTLTNPTSAQYWFIRVRP